MNKLIQILMLSSLIILPSCLNKSELPNGSDLRKFDSVNWHNESSTKPDENLITEREKMLKNLVENVLPGKTKKEIEKLLGESIKTSHFSSINKDLIYYMGPERGSYMKIDSEWLLIWLDNSGKFKKYEIVND